MSVVFLPLVTMCLAVVDAQEAPVAPPVSLQPPAAEAVAAPKQVGVQQLAGDAEISERLTRIFAATGWFRDTKVQVDEGVVFLEGIADREEYRRWAGDLARNTEEVVAVVNKLEVAQGPIWDLAPAMVGLDELSRDAIAWLPFAVLAVVILAIAGILAWATTLSTRRLLARRIHSPLLREVAARILGGVALLLGVYIVLRVSGLSRLALTVLGGTGLIGLVIGIAFRDITENFLASIFLSVQRPFRSGDLVEIVQILGYVERLTVRTTVVMTLDGNHVQIPNSTVYKSTIRNFTANPNRREAFTVGIGYEVPIAQAQEVALAAVTSHPAVLTDPEPWVLADSLGPATVNLKVYFWLNGRQHSWLKVRSSVIRLVKRSFQENGISMPDEARELVFPQGVPVQILNDRRQETGSNGDSRRQSRQFDRPDQLASLPAEPIVTGAEAGSETDAAKIKDQARQAHLPGTGEDLLATHS